MAPRLWNCAVGALCFSISVTAVAAEPESDAVRARDDRIADLERKVDQLVGELGRVRTQVAVPEDQELVSAYGLGPAASKIYGIERGLSIGGYGEAFYTNFISDAGSGSTNDGSGTRVSEHDLDRSDFLRFVMYLGYKFNENIVFNAEIEFEHAKTGSASPAAGSGSVSVEFAALDFFFNDWINARAGMLLLPMGFINEVHEPPFFHGVQRPEVERRIIPSTWRENGVGIFGNLHETLSYRAYITTGFNATGFSDAGIRDGRQNGNRSFAEDLAFVTRLDWTPVPSLLLGGSFYTGGSGHDQEIGGIDLPDSRLTMYELHAQYRVGGLETRALFAVSELASADKLNTVLGRALDRPIAERMIGGYGELAYNIAPFFFGPDRYLAPFVRVEYIDPQDKVPSGFLANRNRTRWLYTTGLSWKPHPNVVLKAEYRNFQADAGDEADEVSIGMGFAF
ncbi:MAG: hypothetical protein HKP27_10300 [Myxococcales bacterium]|nr:hypothetical protein [Myxococcales bacterium]